MSDCWEPTSAQTAWWSCLTTWRGASRGRRTPSPPLASSSASPPHQPGDWKIKTGPNVQIKEVCLKSFFEKWCPGKGWASSLLGWWLVGWLQLKSRFEYFSLLDVEQAWTSVFYLKSFDMDSVQVGKAVFGKEIYTTPLPNTTVHVDLKTAIPELREASRSSWVPVNLAFQNV